MTRSFAPWKAAVACTAWLAAAVPAQQPTVQTIINNGTTQTRYDVVILGDGYQAAQQAQFNTDVLNFLAVLFQKEPYQTFSAYYNVHTVFRASVDAGADHPDAVPPIYRNTAYDATYNWGGVDRCLYIGNSSQALADAALAPATEGRVLVLVNDSRYGGCAATFAVSYNGSLMGEVQSHELGHSLGQLADEYDYPYQTYTGGEPNAVNITTSPLGQKWSIWHGTDGISAFQGAGYYLYGLYRPKNNCLMRNLGVPMCAVCRENVTKITNSIVRAIVQTSPASTSFGLSQPSLQTFSFQHIVPPGNLPLIRWRVDGVVVPGATGTSYVFDSTTVPLGLHSIEASVLDQTTFVRSDPQEMMRDVHVWNVTVNNPAAAQLRIPSAAPSTLWVNPGTSLTLDAMIANDGPAAAGSFDVDFFLSTAPAWTPQDTWLGKVTVPGLAATQSTTVHHPVQLPWSLGPNVHYVTAVADRAGVVVETNETDNTRVMALFVGASPCVTKLEYDDPLTYPFDTSTLSIAAGGTRHPTIVAPCANPATTLYLILWGASGTVPGVTLAPGVNLALNPDPFTQVTLNGLNSPMFGQFLGVLDAQGRGQATFTLPPGVSLVAGPTHFAGVLLGASQLFSDATNAITLQLVP